MSIIVINKEIFHKRPPVISTVLNLSELGQDIVLITVEINNYWKEELTKRGIKIYIVPDFQKRNQFSKIIEYIRFRNSVFSYLRKNGLDNDENVLWVIGGNTIYSLGSKLKKFRFILQIQELHENDKNYLRIFRKVINSAERVIVPEYTRALLYKVWFGLKDIPTVLPNKPYFMPDNTVLESLQKKYSNLLENLRNYKIILYQGYIFKDRDLSNYIRAYSKLKNKNEYKFVLLGNDIHGMVQHYRQIEPDIIHIEHLPAPDYLLFTRQAYIGILCYSPTSENNIFCAPNKLFEYSAYGVPVIGNNISGLSLPIQTNKMGEIVDEDNPESIIRAIETIETSYDDYSRNSKSFFENTDNKATIAKSIKLINK